MDERKENFEETSFPIKICLGEALFSPLEQAKDQHQNFEKHLKQKRCYIRRLNVPKFCYF